MKSRTAADICRTIKLKGEALTLLREGMPPREFFELLMEKEEHSAAIRFLPQALSKRAAIWWGSLCLWRMTRPEPTPEVEAVLSAALAWVQEPCEETRRAAEALGRAAGVKTAHGCLAMAVFWSGGSMTNPGGPVISPPPHLAGKLVSSCLFLAAVLHDAFKFRTHYQEFLGIGIDVARGINHWSNDDVTSAPAPETAAVTPVFAGIDH